MGSALPPLTLELLGWLSSRPRRYSETMEVWGSHCPRHPVWEDALADGLVEVTNGRAVMLTALGRARLAGEVPSP